MLEVKNLTQTFSGKKILDKIEFDIKSGKTLALLGPSGAGKSSLLDCIAGFLKPDFGAIRIHGEEVLSTQNFVAPEKRRVGLVFQTPNLFPHLNLYDNVSFGVDKNKETISKYWLDLLGLKEHSQKFPHEISGGEQQRVAIARALAPRPSLCLLDEPFCKLDTYLKKRVIGEVKEFLSNINCTSIVVTHDLQEALEIGDDLAFLAFGRLYDLGSCSKFDLQNVHPDLNYFFN